MPVKRKVICGVLWPKHALMGVQGWGGVVMSLSGHQIHWLIVVVTVEEVTFEQRLTIVTHLGFVIVLVFGTSATLVIDDQVTLGTLATTTYAFTADAIAF